MNTIALPLPSGRGYRRRSNVTTLALQMVVGVRDGLRMLRRYKELAHKSDAELARLGLKREDLPHVAVTGTPAAR
jgi:hypothetical protein